MKLIYKSCRLVCAYSNIFNDVRDNYSDFNQWFKKCKELDRTIVVVDDYSAIAILKYKSNSIKICTFVVDHNQRKKGIGSTLILNLVNHAKKMNKQELYVSVLKTNVRFIDFCKKHDFYCQSDDGENLIFVRKT